MRLLLAIFLLLSSVHIFAQNSEKELPNNLYTLLKKLQINEDNLAIFVQKVDSNQAKISHNVDLPMQTASIMKIVTAYAALELLGPSYTWKSKIYSEQAINNGSISQPLYFVAGGDPKLLLDKFWILVQELKAQGLKHIKNDIIIDNSYFNDLNNLTDEKQLSSFDENILRPYNVHANSLLLNLQTIPIYFSIAENTIRVSSIPAISDLTIKSQIKLNDSSCDNWQNKLKFDFQTNERQLKITGSYPISCQNKVIYLALFPSLQQFEYIFRNLWTADGGTWSGKASYGKLEKPSKLLLEFSSPPLSEIIRDMNKYSLNPVAKNLFLTIGKIEQSDKSDKNDNLKKSIKEQADINIKLWLKNKGIDSSSLALENGSGLSRHEKFSAKFIGELLLNAWQSPLMPDIISSFPIISIDGTLKKRMLNSNLSGRAYLKTGSIDQVKSIAGIVNNKKGERFVVVMIINHPQAANSAPIFDELLRYVVDEGE